MFGYMFAMFSDYIVSETGASLPGTTNSTFYHLLLDFKCGFLMLFDRTLATPSCSGGPPGEPSNIENELGEVGQSWSRASFFAFA